MQASVPYNIGQIRRLRIEAQGTSLTISIDGSLVFSVIDAAIGPGTIGLYAWGNAGSYFDDVVVEQL